MKSHAEKTLFRAAGAKDKFEHHAVGKTWEQGFESLDETWGEYLALGAVINKFGGSG